MEHWIEFREVDRTLKTTALGDALVSRGICWCDIEFETLAAYRQVIVHVVLVAGSIFCNTNDSP